MGVESEDVASAVLQGPAWGMLLATIGDSLMLYLLTHSSIFVQMANGCYLQVTGQPINKVQPPTLAPSACRSLFIKLENLHSVKFSGGGCHCISGWSSAKH